MKSLFICIILLPIFVFSQTESISDSLNMDNTFGISFSLRSLNLEKFEGGIGGKYWFSNDYSIFASLDFLFSNGDYSYAKTKTASAGISAGIQRHFFVKKIVSPFIGIAFSAEGRFSETKDKNYTDVSNIKRKAESTDYDYSAGIIGGVEVFAMDFISLSAHYGLWIWYEISENKRNYNDGDKKKYKSDYWYLNSGVSSITLSIYF